jgi:hypothetical protein
MTRRLGETVQRRPDFDESTRDKDRLAIVAALPDFTFAAIGTSVPFRAQLLALRRGGAREIRPREGFLARGPTGRSLPSARGKWI